MPSKEGKILVQFNVRNGQYKTASGELSPLTWLTKVSLDKNLATQAIYGDGELQTQIINDKGFTGILGLTARDNEFEIANGMQKAVSGATAEIQQLSIPENAIYFETDYVENKITKSKKVWLFGVEVSAPSESLDQNTDGVNINNAEYAITVKGTNLKATGGTADYVDSETGKTVKVFKLSSIPTDSGYTSFGDSVPVPTVISTVINED